VCVALPGRAYVEQMSDDRRHAVVVGGSMAGLLAARALVEHFDQVTIVERDRFPEEPAFRKGVPQSRHVHGLLSGGTERLERAFPGLRDELIAAGAASFVVPADALWLGPAGWLRRFPEGLSVLSATRYLLEWAIRRRVAASDRVRFVEGHDAVGLLANPEGTSVRGVRLRPRGGVEGTPELTADLVVDASGRDSPAPRWLEELGRAPPRETRIDAFLGYASRFYAPPPDWAADWRAINISPKAPDHTRGGVIIPVEGGRWLVTLAGYSHDYPPTDEAGFLAFARSLRTPIMAEAIERAQPLGPIYGYQRTDNRLRHYEALADMPERFVVLGDAACCFNPVYGQGMTVAAIAGVVLGESLDRQRRDAGGDLTGFTRRFQRALAKANGPAWLTATGEDLRFPGTEGARPGAVTRIMHWYLDRVIAVAGEDSAANLAFMRVVHMLAPPSALFQPGVIVSALRGARQPPLPGPPTAPTLPVRRRQGAAA
jgi:2-polyprenyl-6-methoxyphenol hydroxylase-like FAD-dependent oxidoreductase